MTCVLKVMCQCLPTNVFENMPHSYVPLGGCRGCCDNWLRTDPSGSCARQFCSCTASSGASENHMRVGGVQSGKISGRWQKEITAWREGVCWARGGVGGKFHRSPGSHTLGNMLWGGARAEVKTWASTSGPVLALLLNAVVHSGLVEGRYVKNCIF